MKNQRGFDRLSSWTLVTTDWSPAWFGPPWLLATGSGDPKKTVRVERRRRSEPAGDAGRPRAEAPQRRRADEPPPRPPSGTGGGTRPPFRPSMPSGPRRPISIGLLLVLLLCAIPIYLFLGPGDSDETSPAEVLPLETGFAAPQPVIRDTPRPTATPKPVAFTPAAVSAEGHTWLVMLYQDADDKIF